MSFVISQSDPHSLPITGLAGNGSESFVFNLQGGEMVVRLPDPDLLLKPREGGGPENIRKHIEHLKFLGLLSERYPNVARVFGLGPSVDLLQASPLLNSLMAYANSGNHELARKCTTFYQCVETNYFTSLAHRQIRLVTVQRLPRYTTFSKMPKVEGWNLFGAIAYLESTFSGLSVLHENDLIHGDLQAANSVSPAFGPGRLADPGSIRVLGAQFNMGNDHVSRGFSEMGTKEADVANAGLSALRILLGMKNLTFEQARNFQLDNASPEETTFFKLLQAMIHPDSTKRPTAERISGWMSDPVTVSKAMRSFLSKVKGQKGTSPELHASVQLLESAMQRGQGYANDLLEVLYYSPAVKEGHFNPWQVLPYYATQMQTQVPFRFLDRCEAMYELGRFRDINGIKTIAEAYRDSILRGQMNFLSESETIGFYAACSTSEGGRVLVEKSHLAQALVKAGYVKNHGSLNVGSLVTECQRALNMSDQSGGGLLIETFLGDVKQGATGMRSSRGNIAAAAAMMLAVGVTALFNPLQNA